MAFKWILLFSSSYLTLIGSQLIISNVTNLGPLHSPDITGVSRDGGASVLLNSRILWIFDDTECLSATNQQLGFVSNSASYSSEPNGNISLLNNFGVVTAGNDEDGHKQYAIRAGGPIGTGGWIPFKKVELEFNGEQPGKDRIAIWPGANPTPISPVSAFLYAPLVYVNARPQDPSKKYNSRGMTLISIEATSSRPIASRVLELLFPGNELGWGGFAALLGTRVEDSAPTSHDEPDVYAFASIDAGLQVARAKLGEIHKREAYTYFQPSTCSFVPARPDPNPTNDSLVYLPGSFSSGSLFYSPYIYTFLLVYLNNLADSTFRIRYLDLHKPICSTGRWTTDGKDGRGISADDAEAVVRYAWSPEQTLYVAPAGAGGFNYDGFAHPQFFNRRHYPRWVSSVENDWYGAAVVPEDDAGGDGKHLLLTWTSQEQGGNYGDGRYYQVMMAKVEFGDSSLNFSPRGATATGGANEIGSSKAGDASRPLLRTDRRPSTGIGWTTAVLMSIWMVAVTQL